MASERFLLPVAQVEMVAILFRLEFVIPVVTPTMVGLAVWQPAEQSI
jgi:hypothetical protein